MRYHRPRESLSVQLDAYQAGIERQKTHIIEDVEIGVQRVSSCRGGAIIGNFDSIVERIQVDAVDDKRHLGGSELVDEIDGRCGEIDGSPKRRRCSSLKKCTRK
jgi:hypothetical protein